MEWAKKGPEKRYKAILNCTDDPELDWLGTESWISMLRLNHWDGEEYPVDKIKQGIDWITIHMQMASAVIVCCHAGVSRSPGMIVAYLISLGYNYNEAIRITRKSRPIIQIHPKIDLSIRKYFGLSPRTAADLIPGSSLSGY